ncbi:MAG: hypothetical protein C4581_11880 [Nitrospiraceae bacterium]|nr:MAG: hypothetical protein C4581_11880 [Nitrospiraceae bacterium]
MSERTTISLFIYILTIKEKMFFDYNIVMVFSRKLKYIININAAGWPSPDGSGLRRTCLTVFFNHNCN